MQQETRTRWAYRALWFATVFMLAGRAWQHLRWDAPYRALFWNERLLSAWVEALTRMDWNTWVATPEVNAGLQTFTRVLGILFLLGIPAALLLRLHRGFRYVLFAESLLLLFLVYCIALDRPFDGVQWLEYALQVITPTALALVANDSKISGRLDSLLRLAVAATFTGHGLLAVGAFPVPGHFVQMCLSVFHWSEATVLSFLQVMGVLDFIAAALLFVPRRRWQQGALAYMILWGLATTLARVVANFYPAFWLSVLDQWLPASLYRFPHWLVPLCLFVLRWRKTE